jgi:tRNA (guanine9-N1)-methyltransferase
VSPPCDRTITMEAPKVIIDKTEDEQVQGTNTTSIDLKRKRPADAADESSGVVDSSGVAFESSGGDGTGAGTTNEIPPEPPISKNQMKKARRLERMNEVKKRRKEQEKEVKRAKALAQGRDVESEKRLLAERTAAGKNKKMKQDIWERIYQPLADTSWQVSLDCGFESSMTAKEINSLAMQIRYCYSANKRNKHPCLLSATSLGGATMKHLDNVQGCDEWKNRAFTCTSQSLEEYYKADLSNVVYLTSDSEHTLRDLDDTKIYVIGGIVDRNRLKQAALTRAQSLGVTTAKLPLDEHLKKMKATPVLTCNHVFDLLLKYREHGGDWKKALHDVLPQRKGAEIEIDGDEDSEPETGKDDSKSV